MTQTYRITYVIAQPCVDVKDRACVNGYPVDCTYEGARALHINPLECVDYGAYEAVCPTEAIFYEDDLPTEWEDYPRANRDFFGDIGTPGGTSSYGPVNKSDSMIAVLPPMDQ